MRRWLGWTWVLLLVCVAAVSMCGSRKPGYGSGYALTSAGYSRGNTGTGFYDDTLTVVFTTQDVLTAGVLDTTKVGTAGSPAAPYDSQRRDTFKARLAEADTIHRLGAGFKVAAFAHGLVDTTEPEGYGTPSGYQSSMQAGIRVGAGPYTHNRTYNVAGRRSELFYIPFEKYIPAGSTIISAIVNVSANTNADATTADSLYANLITTPDNKWYTAKRGSFFADYAKTAWSRQISNNPTGSITWSATNSDPWSPGISAGRTGFKSWGAPEDQTALPGAIASRRQVDFSIKNCVQAAVSGSTNNGIIVNLGWKSNGFQALFNHYFWDDYSDAIARTPYVVVKYTKRRYAGALDMTPPSAPSMGVTFAGSGYVYVSWTNNSSEPVTFNLYRFFDNAADTTLVASAVSGLNAFDLGAVNGSPHNYFVRAVDRSGNLSAPSSASRLFPGYIRSITRPAYYALWFQDAPNIGTDENEWTVAEWQAKLDSLSLFDAVVTGPFPLEITAEQAFNGDDGGDTGGITAELRSRNADQTVLTYVHPWQMREEWSLHPSTSLGKRMQTYLASVADSALFGKNLAHRAETRMEYPGTRFVNIMVPSTADTLAAYAVSAFDRSGADGEYCGLFVDDLVTTLTEYMCASGACDDVMDFDQDGTPYASDAQEKAAWQAWQVRFLKALRREFAERGMPNRLLAANSNFGRAATMSAAGDTIMKLLDGHMTESPFEWWPGEAAADTTWERAFAIRDRLTTAQISPALQMFQVKSDSSIIDQSEVLALAADAWVCANQNTPENAYGNNNVPPMVPADERLPYPGLFSSVTYADGGADPDTLKAKWSILTGRILLDHVYTSEADDDYGVMPYVVYTSTDTLSRSVFWESEGDIGAPTPDLQYHTTALDREIAVRIYPSPYSDPDTWLPRDFSHFRIVRESKPASVVIRDTFMVDPDTLEIMYEEPDSYLWMSVGLTNGVQYKHKVTAFDVLGNSSDEVYLSDQDRYPVDTDAPPAVADLYAQGGEGYVDLDWTYPAFPADFEHFRIWRRITGSGLAFTLTDSVAISAHQDSTATSGTEYDYYVVAVDDDENASAASDTVVGSWYGDIEETYLPPTLVRALADNPTGRTSVVVYPPTDVTGLTGYSIYRGPYTGFASIDTAACVLYKQNIAPDIFNGAVFEDQHANTNPDSAFQYTARALYSGNASIKYPVPASALTTGGFSAQVPSCIAYGTGSDIAVAVVVLAGADSTRIFRGTSSGSQAYLTTVPIGTNPWTDSTATANTDYWYKVRQVDGALVSEFSAVAGPARWTSTPSGDPSISTVTGAVSHGSTITIAGSNFGTKATAAPQKYDDFESYSEGATATTADGWSSVDWGGNGPGMPPIYSSTAGHVGKGLMARFENGGSISRVRLDRDWSGGFYIDYWYTHVEAGERSRNLKPWRLYGNGQGSNEFPQFNVLMQCASGSVQLPVSTNTGGPNPYFTSVDNLVGAMRHWQIWAKPDITDGGDGYSNGSLLVMLNGQVVHRNDAWRSNDAACDGNYWYQLSISGYYSRSVDGGSCPSTYITGNAYEYWDNLYIDNTQARVEIGNASTYATCTHREIQIPSAWAAGSITVTANTGSFADGSAYLFVIDSDGTASAGYPITVDAP